MELKGKVRSGYGNASFWVEKISKIFKEKYHINLFYGTLNIELYNPFVLDSKEKIQPNEYDGKYEVLVKKGIFLEQEVVYIVRPEINNTEGGDHSLKIIELVSEINLRKKYNLNDGDEVKICIDKK